MSTFSGVIFDFNGVLWWDSALQECSWKQFSATLRGMPLSDEELRVHVHGRNNRHTLEYLTGRALAPEEVERLTEQKEQGYRQLCLAQDDAFRLAPGAETLLDWLVAHAIPRTIATASGKSNVDFFAAHLRLGQWFDLGAVVYDDGARPGKPAPDIYLQAARNLRLAPGRCIVIEDSHSGIAAAHAAGIGYIVGLASTHPAPALAALPGVSRVIKRLSDFPVHLLDSATDFPCIPALPNR